MEEDLPPGHAQHQTGLLLPLGHALDAAPVDFREVAGVVDDEGHAHGQHPARLAAGPVEPLLYPGHIEQRDDLQHQRGAADDPHHRAGDPPQGSKAAHGAETDDQAQRQRPHKGDEEQLEGLEEAAVQGGYHRLKGAGSKKFKHGIVLSGWCDQGEKPSKGRGRTRPLPWLRAQRPLYWDLVQDHGVLQAVGGGGVRHGAVGHLLRPECVECIHQVGALPEAHAVLLGGQVLGLVQVQAVDQVAVAGALAGHLGGHQHIDDGGVGGAGGDLHQGVGLGLDGHGSGAQSLGGILAGGTGLHGDVQALQAGQALKLRGPVGGVDQGLVVGAVGVGSAHGGEHVVGEGHAVPHAVDGPGVQLLHLVVPGDLLELHVHAKALGEGLGHVGVKADPLIAALFLVVHGGEVGNAHHQGPLALDVGQVALGRGGALLRAGGGAAGGGSGAAGAGGESQAHGAGQGERKQFLFHIRVLHRVVSENAAQRGAVALVY